MSFDATSPRTACGKPGCGAGGGGGPRPAGEVHPPPVPPHLRGQRLPPRLRQVVANLLDNALRFTPAGGSVTLTVQTDGGGASLLVQDTGPGFGAGHETRVFERFYRADAGRSGSGLGLAVVRSLAEAHGGRVTAKNAPGGGAVLEVWLPLQKSVSKVGSSRGVIGGGR